MAFESLIDGGGVVTQMFGCTGSGLEWSCWGRGCPYRAGFHAGVDIGAPAGRPVRAVGFGAVVAVGENCGCCAGVAGGCGTQCGLGPNAVIIQSGPVFIKYGHLQSAQVGVGQAVSPRQVLGLNGGCGCSTGTHLHYEVTPLGPPGCDGCAALDPMAYVSAWPGGPTGGGAGPGGPAPGASPTLSTPAVAAGLLLLGGAALTAYLWQRHPEHVRWTHGRPLLRPGVRPADPFTPPPGWATLPPR